MSKGTFGLGVLLGAVAGAGAAYFYAPKTGKELQRDLEREGTKLQNQASVKAQDLMRQAEDQINQISNSGKDSVASPKRHDYDVLEKK